MLFPPPMFPGFNEAAKEAKGGKWVFFAVLGFLAFVLVAITIWG